MYNTEKLKCILGRKVRLNDGKRDLEINIAEMAREIGCSSSEVLISLKQLQYEGEIKRLIQVGWSKDEYTLTVLEKTTI